MVAYNFPYFMQFAVFTSSSHLMMMSILTDSNWLLRLLWFFFKQLKTALKQNLTCSLVFSCL